MYKYKAFDLIIDSEIELPELLPAHESSEIIIRYGSIPVLRQKIKKKVEIGESEVILYSDDSCFIRIKELGLFYITSDFEVIIKAFPNILLNEIRSIILTVIFPTILYLKKKIALHGSVVAYKNHCILFTGESGVGKSTMAARLIKKGYTLVSDDICVIKKIQKRPFVVPATPQLKLHSDAAVFVDQNPSELSTISTREKKGWIHVGGQFEDTYMQLKSIYEIDPEDDNGQEKILNLKGTDKLQTILKNTYKPRAIDFVNLRKHLFEQAVWLSSQVNVYMLKRPSNSFISEECIDKILQEHIVI